MSALISFKNQSERPLPALTESQQQALSACRNHTDTQGGEGLSDFLTLAGVSVRCMTVHAALGLRPKQDIRKLKSFWKRQAISSCPRKSALWWWTRRA
jgi:hypothetical protein